LQHVEKVFEGLPRSTLDRLLLWGRAQLGDLISGGVDELLQPYLASRYDVVAYPVS
jgi:hypothetical protein